MHKAKGSKERHLGSSTGLEGGQVALHLCPGILTACQAAGEVLDGQQQHMASIDGSLVHGTVALLPCTVSICHYGMAWCREARVQETLADVACNHVKCSCLTLVLI